MPQTSSTPKERVVADASIPSRWPVSPAVTRVIAAMTMNMVRLGGVVTLAAGFVALDGVGDVNDDGIDDLRRVLVDDARAHQRLDRRDEQVHRRLLRAAEAGAVAVYRDAKILYGPAKAANAGGVAVSGLEMAQNSMRYSWTREEVDNRLKMIMKSIHQTSLEAAEQYGTPGNYVNGANIAGFVRVANATLDQGLV